MDIIALPVEVSYRNQVDFRKKDSLVNREYSTMKADPKNLKIGILQSKDLHEIVERFSFPWTSSKATEAKWETYLSEQKAGDRIVCLAR